MAIYSNKETFNAHVAMTAAEQLGREHLIQQAAPTLGETALKAPNLVEAPAPGPDYSHLLDPNNHNIANQAIPIQEPQHVEGTDGYYYNQ